MNCAVREFQYSWLRESSSDPNPPSCIRRSGAGEAAKVLVVGRRDAEGCRVGKRETEGMGDEDGVVDSEG